MITRSHCSALHQRPFRALSTMASADFSQFIVTTANVSACETSRDKPASLSSSTCLIYAHGLRLPLGLHCLMPAYPPCTPFIRFLFVRLRFRYPFFSPIPHDTNLGSRSGVRRATTPLVDFHHRLAACPSYMRTESPYESFQPNPYHRRVLFTDFCSPTPFSLK